MKALILAAGIGTRLLPYTRTRPKPLFTLSRQPVIDRLIQSLILAGVESVVVNTHHLAEQIDAHFRKKRHPVPVCLSHEPAILGTGGAISKNAQILGDAPFFVVNGDILTDIDFAVVYAFHLSHGGPVTLVLLDDPEFNSVAVEPGGKVLAIGQEGRETFPQNASNLTFTGIQVVDRTILDYIPKSGFFSSIEAYRRMLLDGLPLFAYVNQQAYWKDIGTLARYRRASLDALAAEAFHKTRPKAEKKLRATIKSPLKGDGSDRTWFRLFRDGKSLVAVDHGIQSDSRSEEMKAWIHIGRFLKTRGIPVPDILACDTFSGWALMQDLGDLSLQDYVRNSPSPQHRERMYKKVIAHLIDFSIKGIQGFDLNWAYQTPSYDSKLILDRECRYFLEAFVNGYLGFQISFDTLREEFVFLSQNVLKHAVFGLMHRDFQSRNIMIRNGRVYFIDFQGARLGPIQYDLASLLIDPYVSLPAAFQNLLLEFAIQRLAEMRTLVADRFREGYQFCAISRNLQALGAFAHLSRVKGKKAFEAYIPAGVDSLVGLMDAVPGCLFPKLRCLVRCIALGKSF